MGGGLGGVEVCYALFEVAEVVYAGLDVVCQWIARRRLAIVSGRHYLQDGEFVHLLALTCGYHVFQHAKLLVHL